MRRQSLCISKACVRAAPGAESVNQGDGVRTLDGSGSWSLPADVPRAVKVTDGAGAGAEAGDGDRFGCGCGYGDGDGKVPFRSPDAKASVASLINKKCCSSTGSSCASNSICLFSPTLGERTGLSKDLLPSFTRAIFAAFRSAQGLLIPASGHS